MKRTSVIACFAALMGAALLAAPTPARAQVEYCNQTSFYLFAAVARELPAGTRSEGWWLLRPGQCRTVVPTPLVADVIYTYAESHQSHLGGIRTWGGRSRLCTGSGLFTIDSQSDCFDRGFEPREFVRVSVGDDTHWTTNFTETDGYDLEQARLAGAQRLLTDIGYEPGAIDGYIGRRTRQAINRFKAEYGVDDDVIVSDVFLDTLIAHASELQDETGYQFCNQTGIELYAAMGYAEGSDWQSFGWWSLDPGTCTKTLKDGLPAEQIYTYAVGYTQDGETLEWGGDYPLCAADRAFEIVGNDDCESRGYTTVGFQRIDTGGVDGWQQSFVLPDQRSSNTGSDNQDQRCEALMSGEAGMPAEIAEGICQNWILDNAQGTQ